VTTVVTQGTYTGLRPLAIGFIPFTTAATGTIAVTIDWTFASNDIDLFLVRGTNPCTVQQFVDGTCPFLGSATSASTKPERVSVANLAAGAYTFYAISFGSSDESIAYQVTLTSVPGASANASAGAGGVRLKERLPGPGAISMR
jgi:hypothetical protein